MQSKLRTAQDHSVKNYVNFGYIISVSNLIFVSEMFRFPTSLVVEYYFLNVPISYQDVGKILM